MSTFTSSSQIVTFLGLSAPEATNKSALLTQCAATANEILTKRLPTVVGVDPLTLQESVKYAATLQAARYFRRSQSPEGTALLGSDSVVRVAGVDADVERLLQPYMSYTGFA